MVQNYSEHSIKRCKSGFRVTIGTAMRIVRIRYVSRFYYVILHIRWNWDWKTSVEIRFKSSLNYSDGYETLSYGMAVRGCIIFSASNPFVKINAPSSFFGVEPTRVRAQSVVTTRSPLRRVLALNTPCDRTYVPSTVIQSKIIVRDSRFLSMKKKLIGLSWCTRWIGKCSQPTRYVYHTRVAQVLPTARAHFYRAVFVLLLKILTAKVSPWRWAFSMFPIPNYRRQQSIRLVWNLTLCAWNATNGRIRTKNYILENSRLDLTRYNSNVVNLV